MVSAKDVKDSYLVTEGKKNYFKEFIVSKSAPSIIFIMTPIGSVGEDIAANFLKGLTGNSCNVFALDYLGIGRSEGTAKDISLKNMKKSTLNLINYIKDNYNDNIHFYGGTGAGGIIGQTMVSFPEIERSIKSLIQFGVGIYGDTTTMGKTSTLRSINRILKFFNKIIPGMRIKFKIPPYSGVNAKKEEEWYHNVMSKDPKAFDFKVSLFSTLLGIFLRKTVLYKNR